MKPKHAPGPWFAKYNEGNKSLAIEPALVDHGYVRIATVHQADEANAALISAAPELLAAAHAALKLLRGSGFTEKIQCLVDLRLAIQKAEGDS